MNSKRLKTSRDYDYDHDNKSKPKKIKIKKERQNKSNRVDNWDPDIPYSRPKF